MFRCHSASYLRPTFWLRAWSVEYCPTSPQLCADVGGSMLLTDCVSPACMSAAHWVQRCQQPWLEKSLSINVDAITSLLTSRVSKKNDFSEATFHFLKTCGSYLNNWPHIFSGSAQCAVWLQAAAGHCSGGPGAWLGDTCRHIWPSLVTSL